MYTKNTDSIDTAALAVTGDKWVTLVGQLEDTMSWAVTFIQ